MIKTRRVFTLVLTLCTAALVAAQIPRSQVVFAYLGLATESLPSTIHDTDVQLLENKIRGSLLEIARQENYSITSPRDATAIIGYLQKGQQDQFRDQLLGFGTNLTASGALLCDLSLAPDGRLNFLVTLYSSPGAEVVAQQSETSATIDALYDRLPAIMYGLFGISPPKNTDNLAQSNSNQNPYGSFSREREVQLRDIVGTWQGDFGLGKVEIFADGSGTGWLDATNSMKLKITVNGQEIVVKQDEPNSPKLYLPVFPYTIASQIVRLARPMSWEFRLTPEKDRLIGKKNTSFVYSEQGQIVQIDNTYSRDAVWTRTP